MEKEKIIKIIDFWQKTSVENGLFPRDLVSVINSRSREIVDIIGVRRSGKSSVLKLLIKELGLKNDFLFLNFEDPFFIENNQPGVIEEIIEIYKEYYQVNLKYLFFDEIQNIEHWEKIIRKLRDDQNYKIFLTGSSSKLLSRELSSLLTGRHLSYKLMPLSFKEYLAFRQVAISDRKEFILRETKINKYFQEYLKVGGFPGVVLEKNEELLKQYYFDILNQDIIRRHNVRQKNILDKMGVYLLSNAAKIVSLNSLQQMFDISFKVAANYFEYFKEAFLVFDLPQFSYSLKTQQRAQKKVYAIDTGLANSVAFRFSQDYGRILENAVFLHLHRQADKIFYYKTKHNLEIDFLIQKDKQKPKDINLIQVCSEMGEPEVKEREIKGLLEAMQELKQRVGLILTKDLREVIKIGNYTILIKPAYEWLLGI